MESLFKYLNENCIKQPNAIMFYPSRKTFAEVFTEIENTKRFLAQKGLQEGDRCLMLTQLGDHFFINLIAVLQLKAVPVLIDIKLGLRILFKALRRINLCAIITTKNVYFIPFRAKFSKPMKTVLSATETEPELIYFTSGSTGLPEAIPYQIEQIKMQIAILRRSRYQENQKNNQTLCESRPINDRILYGYSSLPVFGLYQLLLGMGIWSVPLKTGKCIQSALGGVHRGVLTDFCLNPTLIEGWIDYIDKKYLPMSDSIERLTVVSNPLPQYLKNQLNLRLPLHSLLEQSYGCTEAFPISMSHIPRTIAKAEKSNLLSPPSVGIPNPEFAVQLRPTQFQNKDCFNSKIPAQQIWVNNLLNQWINTGDLGFFNSDKQLLILGREKFTYQFKQWNYFSLLWELKAKEIQEIKQAVLIHEDLQKPPVFIVSLKASIGTRKKIDILNELRQHLKDSFKAEFELLYSRILPTDPRHHTKILREKVPIKRLRWLPINYFIKKSIH